MATTTISPKFQIVIPKEVREKTSFRAKPALAGLGEGWGHHPGAGSVAEITQGSTQGYVHDGSSGEKGPIVKVLLDSSGWIYVT